MVHSAYHAEAGMGTYTLSRHRVPSDTATPQLAPSSLANGTTGDAAAAADDDSGGVALLEALVASALEKYDADKNGTIEMDEFVLFARENPFLSVWFGHLTDASATKASWKDDFSVG